MILNFPALTRVELIGTPYYQLHLTQTTFHDGYQEINATTGIRPDLQFKLLLQDDGRTLKIFVSKRNV